MFSKRKRVEISGQKFFTVNVFTDFEGSNNSILFIMFL